VPPFSLTEPRYDLSTFLGRARHFYRLTDARTLLKSSEDIAAARQLLSDYAKGTAPAGVTDSELWAARNLTESALHPDTSEELPRLFRFSAFGPVNVPICAAMLVPNASAAWTAGVQLFNQVGSGYAYDCAILSSPFPPYPPTHHIPYFYLKLPRHSPSKDPISCHTCTCTCTFSCAYSRYIMHQRKHEYMVTLFGVYAGLQRCCQLQQPQC